MTTEERRRVRAPAPLRLLYIAVGGIGLAAATATVLYPDVELFRQFGPNVATESLALVITVAVVRRILNRQERNRRLRASVGALRKAARSLRVVSESWAELVKGSLPRVPAERPTGLDELLASHYTEALARLDPGVAGPGDEDAEESRVRWRVRRIMESRHALSDITRAYAVVLDGDYVEALEAVVDDRFTSLVAELLAGDADAAAWRRRLNLARGPRESCFRALLLAIRLHNRLAAEAATQRSRDLLPRAELLDIAISVEDDLAIATTLAPEFWTAPPRPTSLRADPLRPSRPSGPARPSRPGPLRSGDHPDRPDPPAT